MISQNCTWVQAAADGDEQAQQMLQMVLQQAAAAHEQQQDSADDADPDSEDSGWIESGQESTSEEESGDRGAHAGAPETVEQDASDGVWTCLQVRLNTSLHACSVCRCALASPLACSTAQCTGSSTASICKHSRRSFQPTVAAG